MSSSTDAATGPGRDALPKAVPALWRTFRLGWRVEPRLLAVSVAVTVARMFPDVLIALWLKMLSDAIVAGASRRILVACLLLAVMATLTWYLGVVDDRVSRRFRDRIAMAMESHIAELQATVPTIEHQERPEYLDRIRVLRDQSFMLDHLFSSLIANFGLVVRLLVTGGLLFSVHPLLVVMLAAGVPAMIVSFWRPGVQRAVEERVARHDRLARHLFEVGSSASAAKEVRISALAGDLRARRRAERARWLTPISSARWASAGWSAAAWALFGLVFALGVVWVAQGLDRPVGDVVLVVVAGQRLSSYLAQTAGELGFLRGVWMDASLRLTWLEDYARRWDQHATGAAPERLEQGITLEDVTFTYPGANRPALEHVSVAMPAGKVVAIVGENGAGKTTLVKLLCGMYRPDSGRILVDETDLRSIRTAAWRTRLAGAFQDFFKFEYTAEHSVGVGDLTQLTAPAAVGRAVERAGALDVIDRLPDGFDTQLGKTWDDGVELSHGQWQKLALARGFMRTEPLVLVLDEPTSALDAETEHALFERYAEAARREGHGGITVLVSHRFSTVRMADLILVLDGSRLTEVGSHDELIARRGTYAELYALQAEAYG